MYTTEYLTIFEQNSILFEAGQMMPVQPPPVNQTDENVEFESIKRYILFNKLKELKSKLLKTKLLKTNPTIQNIFDFIDLVIQFYNTFTYSDCKKLIERISEMIIIANNVQITSHRLQFEPELDQIKISNIQNIQSQQQQQNIQAQKQQELQDHLNTIQKRNAELDLLSKRLDVGMKLHQIGKSLKDDNSLNQILIKQNKLG